MSTLRSAKSGLADNPWLWPLLAALLYGGSHLLWYWQTPLGRHPVLDELENLELARQVAAGALPSEPFYRAMLYPGLLAVFPAVGLPPESWPLAATSVGLMLHLINTTLVSTLARRLFGSPLASSFAGLLYGIHPVLLFYATQIQDDVMATSLFLGGLLCLLNRSSTENSDRRRAVMSALCWSLAALTRPQLLVLVLVWPVAWRLVRRTKEPGIAPLALGAATAVLPWLLLGALQVRVSGEFRLLPTQGAYNLWAANRPGANGRYFVQSIPAPAGATHVNPTRHESLVLFATERGRPLSEVSLDEANAHWRDRLSAYIREDPLRRLHLVGRKAVYLLADYDAYNNKTYAFHRDRAPMLRPNPLGWGLLLAAAIPGLAVLIARDRPAAGVVLLVSATIAATLLLTFVSGRFRIPLLSVLCILAGGFAACASLTRRALALSVAAGLGLGALSLSNPLGARDERTFVQDHLLVSSAALRAGDDKTAFAEAEAALRLRPTHIEALARLLVAGQNLLLARNLSQDAEHVWTSTALSVANESSTVTAISSAASGAAALALWRDHLLAPEGADGDEVDRRASALRLWSQIQALGSTDSIGAREASAALALALYLSGTEPTLDFSDIAGFSGPFAHLAAACARPANDAETIGLQRLAQEVFSPSAAR